MHNDLDNFIVNITDEDIIKEFDDTEWENNVADAAFIGAICLAGSDKKSPEETIHEIVKYNVLKKLNNLFLAKSKPLPKKLVWDKDYDINTAFAVLDNFVAQVVLMKETEHFNENIKLTITITNDILKEKIEDWYSYFQQRNQSYFNINMTRSKNNYIFQFTK